MDNHERETLEREVREHGARIAQLKTTLRDLQENLGHVVDAPPELAKQATLLRMELRGRTAAFAVGSARLQMDD
jgi:chromosome segregation ATPase